LTGVALTIGAVILVAYGLGNGIGKFCPAVANQPLHPCHELGFLPTLPIVSRALRDDMTRRGLKKSQLFWLTALIPLLVPDLSVRASTSTSS